MKTNLLLTATLVLWIALCLAAASTGSGCHLVEKLTYQAPPGVVPVDTTGDGQPDAMARDNDADGIPDLDASGKPLLDAAETARLRQVLASRQAADGTATGALSLLGWAVGLPGLFVGAYKTLKANVKDGTVHSLVRSMQEGRRTVEARGQQIAHLIETGDISRAMDLANENLKALDETLRDMQVKAVQLEVDASKRKQLLPPVTK